MKFIVDHDFHIHSQLSSCSSDPRQNKERILQYAKENGLKKICLTDHFWDSKVPGASFWYEPQNFAHIEQSLPLPQDEQVEFYFGCESDMDKFFTVGVDPSTFDQFDFIIIPTSHMHMVTFTLDEEDRNIERLRELFIKRLEALIAADLPFHKVGLAHMTCELNRIDQFTDHLEIIAGIDDATFTRLFTEIAKKGFGIELNMPIFEYNEEQLECVLRPYRIAKACGCKFYLGGDAHTPEALDRAKAKFERMVDLLELTEEDKFRPLG